MLPFTVVVLTETEVEVTVVLLGAGVTVLMGVVVCFTTAVKEIVVEKVVVGTVATEVAAILVVHPSRVEVEAMTGVVKEESRARAKIEILVMEDMMRRMMQAICREEEAKEV